MEKILRKAINPLRILINDSRFTGIMLIMCTLLSMFLANTTGLAAHYKNLWNDEWLSASAFADLVPENFLSFINNFLMAFFFLMAGMEIKRELISGELSSFKKAILPFGAAVGGMMVPALIFVAFNIHTSYINGWGIPTATDIAFSIGIASLLGKRVPVGLKILLMALAIIDDLGAILVIALFYGGHINWLFLGAGALIYGGLFACNYFKLKFGWTQILLSLALWFAIYNSGVEASITGVLVAFATPVNTLPQIEKAIHKYVNFLILPLFALANTAILLPDHIISSLGTTVGLGIIFGLVIGKPLGIFLFSRILVGLKIASLPNNVKWKQVFGMGALAGIGFTMSIFTTMLAFKQEAFQDIAKVAILISVVLSLAFSLIYFVVISLNMNLEHEAEHAKELKEEKEGKYELNLG
ncbi:Na+/H+ antiporter NhaA [Mucilaginibacter segetis]|uniref:Na(+)/H(+) antiporter NhaA n=1 Tax=Mucilaginibacter segetis TaxID=2793071 RepID=A0A934PQT4_9SPHI|nr:Na+/H+ antiporter NhaA [Mucilaginibacter segetis]MBK0379054.1 Na+/H+ antiporter NhaA [Mucilaginibacter segetis]